MGTTGDMNPFGLCFRGFDYDQVSNVFATVLTNKSSVDIRDCLISVPVYQSVDGDTISETATGYMTSALPAGSKYLLRIEFSPHGWRDAKNAEFSCDQGRATVNLTYPVFVDWITRMGWRHKHQHDPIPGGQPYRPPTQADTAQATTEDQTLCFRDIDDLEAVVAAFVKGGESAAKDTAISAQRAGKIQVLSALREIESKQVVNEAVSYVKLVGKQSGCYVLTETVPKR